MNKLKTIKVLESSVTDLNIIAANTNEKQYEVVDRLAKYEKSRVVNKQSKSKKK